MTNTRQETGVPATSVPQDPPSGTELLLAVSEFLRAELAPELLTQHRLRFRTLVAANLLDMLCRQYESVDLAAWRSLWRMLGELTGEPNEPPPADADLSAAITARQRSLVARIRRADAPPHTADLLRRMVAVQVAVANPRYGEHFEPS